jgi:excisionase family DNA binding protein
MPIMSTGLSDEERKRLPLPRRSSVLGPEWDAFDTFSIEEVGQILRVSRPSIYAAAKRGDIPVIWIGRRGIVPRAALERLLESPRAAAE